MIFTIFVKILKAITFNFPSISTIFVKIPEAPVEKACTAHTFQHTATVWQSNERFQRFEISPQCWLNAIQLQYRALNCPFSSLQFTLHTKWYNARMWLFRPFGVTGNLVKEGILCLNTVKKTTNCQLFRSNSKASGFSILFFSPRFWYCIFLITCPMIKILKAY